MSKSSVAHPRSASYNSTEDEVDIDEEPVDTGLIRCICSSSEDDGFTIQCERCLVWQHAFCVRISQNNIPEHYLCDQCERKSSTPWRQQLEQFSKAVENDVRTVLDKKLRHEFRENNSDKQHFRDIHNRIGDDDDYKPGVANRRPLPKKNPVGRPPKRPKLSKKIAVSKRSLQELHGDDRLVRRNGRLNAQKRSFERISYNVIRSKHVKQVFKDAHERWHKSKEKVSGLVGDDCLKNGKRGTVRPLSTQWRWSSLTEQRQGLFADEELERNQLVGQVNGDIVLKSEYKFDPANDFCVLGTPCAQVFFYPTLDLCIDARSRGNDARHVRRSCHPNAELRAIVSAHDPQIRLGLFARRHVHAGDELTIGYNWQRGHISWKKNLEWHDCGATDGHQVIDEESERANRSALIQMLSRFDAEFGVCACQDTHLCFIEHLKALLSGSDEPPLANYNKASPNGHVSDTQSSRQTIVDNLAKPLPVEASEDGIVIDVVSTSPLVRSPVISTPKRVSDTEEELDVDGDIDVGDESMDYVPAPERQLGSDRPLSRASSQSSFSGPDHARNGKRPRPSNATHGPLKRQSVGSHDDMHGPAKLPCKKAWMRHFMQQVTPAPVSTNNSKDEQKSEKQKQEQPAVEEETSHTKPSPSPTPPPPLPAVKVEQPEAVEMEDDGELSDASSASTIPINEQDDDRMNGLQEEVPSQQQADDGEALSSETDEQNKPTKVKLSLQEYLARRGTSGQKVGSGDKSQDCGASTEEHRWMTATNQVEVTMEVRPHEAQH